MAPNSNNAQYFIVRALTKTQLKHNLEAPDDFDHAVTINPNEIMALFFRAATYDHLGRYSEAVADYDRFIASDSPWRDKARRLRQLCQQKINQRNAIIQNTQLTSQGKANH